MNRKCLMTASTFSHIRHFHLPYIKAFREMGWEVHVAAGGSMVDGLGSDSVFGLPFEKRISSPANFRAALRLRKIIRQNGYELIICHTSLAAFFTRLAVLGIKRKCRIINVVHGYLFDERSKAHKALILKAAECIAAPMTDLVLTMNQWDMDWARTHKVSKEVRSIPGMGLCRTEKEPIITRETFGIDMDSFVLVYPAEFSERKNQAMLIRAMTQLPENVRLVLPGEGEMLVKCKNLVSDLGLGKRVIFPGYLENVVSFLPSADAAVTSSRSEGLPFNVMEAMHSGLPVIASAVKGNMDLVRHGVNGFTYPYDDEAACARCVIKLMNDKTLAENMGSVGKNMAEQYTIEKALPVVMNEYIACTKSVLN